MAGRPPRQNRNPRYANNNNNNNNNNTNEEGNGPPPQFNLNQADLMAIATIVATTLQGLVNPNANQQHPPPPHHGVKFHYESLRKNRCPTFSGAADPKAPDMSVVEYTSQFNALGSYAPAIMADEVLKLHRFKKGLNSRIQSALAVYQPANFSDLMGAAIQAEADIRRREGENRNKRPLNSQPSQGRPVFKRPNQSGGPPSGKFPATNYQGLKPCSTCGFKHSGECRRASGVCFGCGKAGHRIAECPTAANRPAGPNRGTGPNTGAGPSKPKEDKPNARIFTMTQEEADDATEVVSGTILTQSVPAYALFDCGATHSFMFKRFAKKLRRKPDKLTEPFRIATPTSRAMETDEIYRDCEISINNQTFSADLIQLIMVDFDIILGMDWLARNNAVVDCKGKEVKLRTPNQEEVVFHGKSKGRKSLLSASQAWKAMKSGEDIYLAMVSEAKEEVELKLEDIPVVRDFPDIFPEELSGTAKWSSKSTWFPVRHRSLRHRHVISREGVSVDPRKVEAITEWPRPKNATDIISFLGLAGYYRKFVEGFSSIAVPLTKLTQKNSKFIWDDDCEKSFQTLKEKLASTPVLILPAENKDFIIYSDTSKEGLGCNYPTHDLELAAVVFALRFGSTISMVLNVKSSQTIRASTNKVADALSRKGRGKITLASLSALPCLQETVKLNQDRDPVLTKLKEQVREGKSQDHQIDDKGILWMKGRLGVPDSDNLRQEIMAEAHKSKFSVHPGSTKMYRDLKNSFWWNGMKRDVGEFVSRCQVCQQVKAEHQRPGGLLQPLEIPEWNYHSSIGMAPYEAFYGRKCRSPLYWDEVGEKAVVGPELVQMTVDKVKIVRGKLKAAQDRQKSWADLKRRPVEFNVGEKAYVKVSPMRGVVRFSKAGKLNPRYVGPFDILEKVGTLACRLAQPPNMSRIHNVFHVSQLRRYIPDPSHVLEIEPLLTEGNLGEGLKYEEVPIRIVDTKE
ncbi:uncharacterized protein LOC142520334 [Primulina tabacum]|uniref:uncharacterized protein LOC142520334 n=1 Tax=Primulina tabacum TaxID=48773 RepID=UPI003F59BF85